MANKTIHKVLVDNRSSADIIFASAFNKMGIGKEKLEPVNTYLRGFSGERVLPLRSTQLVLTLGDPPCQATTIVRFLIVDAPSAYNMLLGRPSLNAIRAIPSAYHMVIKFPIANGVGMVRGNQRIARECYSASMKQKKVDNIYKDELDMRDEVSTFQILKGYNMKLNPAKCAFGVSTKKGLGALEPSSSVLEHNCSRRVLEPRSPVAQFIEHNCSGRVLEPLSLATQFLEHNRARRVLEPRSPVAQFLEHNCSERVLEPRSPVAQIVEHN